MASNELDEDLIADLKRQGAPINSWGVGTHLITSSDHPALGGVYKLVAVRPGEGTWEPRIKLSSNPAKMTDPGRKRLVRYYDGENRPLADLIRLDDEDVNCIDPGQAYPPVPFAERQDLSFLRAVWDATRCEQLLQPVMADGARIDHRPSLEEIRARAELAGGIVAGGDPASSQPGDIRGRLVSPVGGGESTPHQTGAGSGGSRAGRILRHVSGRDPA